MHTAADAMGKAGRVWATPPFLRMARGMPHACMTYGLGHGSMHVAQLSASSQPVACVARSTVAGRPAFLCALQYKRRT